jgi:hypothetical protein
MFPILSEQVQPHGSATESRSSNPGSLLAPCHDTVRKHTSSILAKLGVETRAAAVSMVRDFS